MNKIVEKLNLIKEQERLAHSMWPSIEDAQSQTSPDDILKDIQNQLDNVDVKLTDLMQNEDFPAVAIGLKNITNLYLTLAIFQRQGLNGLFISLALNFYSIDEEPYQSLHEPFWLCTRRLYTMRGMR
jgi:hypothetical protein